MLEAPAEEPGIAAGQEKARTAKFLGGRDEGGDIFIRLLIMSAIPLIFFTLMSGLTRIKEAGFVGRLAARILVYYAVTSVLAFAVPPDLPSAPKLPKSLAISLAVGLIGALAVMFGAEGIQQGFNDPDVGSSPISFLD